jgi:hypothetical protein
MPPEEDAILCWKLTPNGKCITKSTYKTCLQALQNSGLPSPTPVDEITKKVFKQVWTCKQIIPRVKTFAWILLRHAIPSGDKASRYSTHINKLCCRCGLPRR